MREGKRSVGLRSATHGLEDNASEERHRARGKACERTRQPGLLVQCRRVAMETDGGKAQTKRRRRRGLNGKEEITGVCVCMCGLVS